MKITKRHDDDLIDFYILAIGDTFLFDNKVYLKLDRIDPEDEAFINAVCLNSGEVFGFNLDTRVKKVYAELIIEV